MKFAYIIIGVAITLCWGSSAIAQKIDWISQDGNLGDSEGSSVSTDILGNVYITGTFTPAFPPSATSVANSIEPEHLPRNLGFVSKYDASGTLHWTKKIGTDPSHTIYQAYGSSTDGLGNVYVVGDTLNIRHGNEGWEVFLKKYDSAGNIVWGTKLGTDSTDNSTDIATDGLGNIYVTGYTWGDLGGDSTSDYSNAFLSKYDDQGTLQWSQLIGTTSTDHSYGVTVDEFGDIIISGDTGGDIGGTNSGYHDAFFSKFDSDGNLLWSEQLGTMQSEQSNDVATDPLGNIYITGFTKGDLGGTNAGAEDAFVSKFDSLGILLWTTQLGGFSKDESNSLAVDEFGNVYFTGFTFGDFPGSNEDTRNDAFVSMLSSDGNLLWSKQIGTRYGETSNGVSVDSHGNIYITGQTAGDLGIPNYGNRNVFLAKILPYSADFDDDTDVDIVDFNHWETNFGQNAGSDADFDGDTDGIDFLIWQRQLGSILPTSTSQFAATATVPEPATLLIFALTVIGVLARRMP